MDRMDRITTRCPSCGCQTLFIGSGGHLTCSLIGCLCPSVEDRIADLQAKAHRYEAIAAVVSATFVSVTTDGPASGGGCRVAVSAAGVQMVVD